MPLGRYLINIQKWNGIVYNVCPQADLLYFPSSLEDIRSLAGVLGVYHQLHPQYVLLLFSSAYLFKQVCWEFPPWSESDHQTMTAFFSDLCCSWLCLLECVSWCHLWNPLWLHSLFPSYCLWSFPLLLFSKVREVFKNIAKGITDPRVEFCLPK